MHLLDLPQELLTQIFTLIPDCSASSITCTVLNNVTNAIEKDANIALTQRKMDWMRAVLDKIDLSFSFRRLIYHPVLLPDFKRREDYERRAQALHPTISRWRDHLKISPGQNYSSLHSPEEEPGWSRQELERGWKEYQEQKSEESVCEHPYGMSSCNAD